MAVIEKSTVIDAPAETVFKYVDEPTNAAKIGPGVDRVEVLRRTDERIGDSFRLIYSALGVDFPVTLVTTANDPPRTLAARMEGGMSGEFRWSFRETEPGRTETGVRVDYEVKGDAIGRAVDALILERLNEKNAERMLENMKQRVESVPATGV